jgi:prophage regulatory protein
MSRSFVLSDGSRSSLFPITLSNAVEPEAVAMTEGKQTEEAAPAEPRPQAARRMITEKQVQAIVPFARSTIWRMERDGRFPKGIYPFKVRRKFWYEDEVRAWQDAMDGQPPPRRRRPRPKTTKPAKQTA